MTTQSNLTSNKKDNQHQSHLTMAPSIHNTTQSSNNSNINLLQDLKNSVNLLPTNIQTNTNLTNFNMSNMGLNLQQNLGPVMSIHSQLESMMNSSHTGMQNSHNMTMSASQQQQQHQQQQHQQQQHQHQQHSNGFSIVKTQNSPPNMMTNNGLTGLGMGGIGIPGLGMGSSIFDPLPTVTMPMQMPMLPIKKEEKPIITQPQMSHKSMDGKINFYIFVFNVNIFAQLLQFY